MLLLAGVLVLSIFSFTRTADAQVFNSASYNVLQPIVNTTNTGSSASFQVVSNIGQINIFPTDLNGPTISGVHAPVVGYTSAEVRWVTDIVASSTLSWGTTSGVFTTSTSSSAMTIVHALKMGDLSESTTYYYKVTSYDALGHASTSTNGGGGYTFTTPASTVTVTSGGGTRTVTVGDTTFPTMGTITITDITTESAKVSFTTSKLTNDLIKPILGFPEGFTAGNEDLYQKKHAIELSKLKPDTTYSFYVKVLDAFNYTNQSTTLSFKTPALGASTTTTVTFEPAGTLEKLSDIDNSTIEKFSKVIKVAPLKFVTNALKAFLGAIADNPVAKDINEESFTSAVSEAASKIISSPEISGTDITVVPGPDSAVITWTTDKRADSLVAFAKSTDFKLSSENPYSITVGFPDEQEVKHRVYLENLEASTLYHFQIRSQGKLGPIALTSDKTFTTLSLTPEISNVKFTAITDNSANVEWETNLPTKNTISITNARTGEIQTKEDKSFLKIHQISLKDFTPSTGYTLRLKAVDETGRTSFPSVLPFTTAMSTTPPKVSQVRIVASLIPDQIDTVQTIVSWKTDKPATSQIFYGEGITRELTKSTAIDNAFVRDHIVITTDLKAGQVYQVQVRSNDPQEHTGQSDFYTTLTPRPKQSAIDLIFKNLDSTFGFLKF